MIQFLSPGIQLTKLRMAYNNDVIRFHSTTITDPAYCDITIIDGFSVRLYPTPEGHFFFNFKSFITSLINTRNFEDTLDTDLQTPDPASFIYDYTAGSYLKKDVFFSIHLGDGVTSDDNGYNLAWLAGVEQLGDYKAFARSDYFLLTPFKELSDMHFYLKYWQGYPFDVAIYNTGPTIRLNNQTNLLQQQFDNPGIVSRLFFSDGRTDESLEDLLPLVEGYNDIRLMLTSTPSIKDKFLTLEKVPYKCGVYLKWLNRYGGYSYWLFENTYSVNRTTKQLGELDRDNENLEDTFSRAIQLGKESQDTYRIIADLINEDERRILEGIIDSPKIYLFTGQPFARNDYNDWIEVTLKTTNIRVKNPKEQLTNFAFDIELPARYTQTL